MSQSDREEKKIPTPPPYVYLTTFSLSDTIYGPEVSMIVGFTLSQATKFLRESKGMALLYF